MSCNIKIPLDQIITDVADALKGKYISVDNPFLNEAVMTDTTFRGDLTMDTEARNALCLLIKNCNITAEELAWLARPTVAGQVPFSRDTVDGGIVEWRDLEALILEYAADTIAADKVITADGTTQEQVNQNQKVTNEAQAQENAAQGRINENQGIKNQGYDNFIEDQELINASYAGILQYVKGDGTDETVGLRAYHDYCNTNKVKSSYKGLSGITIQANAQIIVNTDWDFSGIELTLLGGEVEISSQLTYNVAFRVFDERCVYTTRSTPAFLTANLVKGSLQPAKGSFDDPGLIYILDGNTRVAGRNFESEGVRYSQSFHSLGNGQVSQPLSRTLSNTAHSNGDAPRMLYRRNSPDGALVVSNLTITYGSDYNFQKVVSIERNAVTLENVKIVYKNWTPRYTVNNLIAARGVANLRINGFVGVGLPVQDIGGAYLLRLDVVADVYLDNIQVSDNTVQGGSWGWIGTNFANGIYVTNSSMGRLDGHESIHNVFVNKTTFTDIGVTYGWGGGSIMVNQSKLVNSSAVFGRIDYGNAFYGSISITNIIVEESLGTARALYSCKHAGSDSTIVQCPENITIDNVMVNTSEDLAFFAGKDGRLELINITPAKKAGDKNTASKNQNHVYAPASVNISNITASHKVDVYINLALGSFTAVGNKTIVNINNIISKGCYIDFLATNSTVLGDTRKTLNRVSANITNINTTSGCEITSRNYPISELEIDSISRLIKLQMVDNMYEGIKSVINVYNSYIYDFVGNGLVFGNVSDKTTQHRTAFFNCNCNSGANLSKAGILQGNTVRGSVTLPTDVTPRDAFLGWHDQTNFALPAPPPVVP